MDDHDEPLLDVVGLAKTYGRRKVVDGVDLYVGRQEIIGLLGPNGAGKTTCFRMICGLIEPDRGRVFLNGVEVTNWPMFKRCRDGHMGYLAQESSVFRKLSVEQNLLAIMELIGMDRKTRRRRCGELLDDFEIKHLRKSKAAKLSGGERRRLEIARCLVSDPEIIMLDEPFAGIDPVTVQNIQVIIRRLRDDGLSILITDHAAREILQVTDRCYVINKGTVLFDGTPAEVLAHPEVKRIYLGDLDTGESGPPPPHFRPSTPRPDDLAALPLRRASHDRSDVDVD